MHARPDRRRDRACRRGERAGGGRLSGLVSRRGAPRAVRDAARARRDARLHAAGTRIVLRPALLSASPAASNPISVDGGPDICVAGGTVRGEYARSLGWAAMHDMNNAGVAFASPTTVDGVRIDDVTDGLRLR